MGRDPLGVDTDLFVRGNADAETLWQGLVHGANNQHPKQGATGRWGVADYNTLGYVAHDKGRHGTVARTLEYAYDDWCIWQFGKAIGKSDDETAQYRRNAGNWRNVIEAKDASRSRYVEGVAFNGRAVNANWLSAADLAKGGRLVFRMSSKPVKTRGTTLAAAPYSMSKDEKK